MPSHFHPRSRTTSSLFATTLFASFFIVALPHILPCPAPKVVAFTDDGTRPPSRRLEQSREVSEKHAVEGEDTNPTNLESDKRECPIPKPSGLLRGLFGLESNNDNSSSDKRMKP